MGAAMSVRLGKANEIQPEKPCVINPTLREQFGMENVVRKVLPSESSYGDEDYDQRKFTREKLLSEVYILRILVAVLLMISLVSFVLGIWNASKASTPDNEDFRNQIRQLWKLHNASRSPSVAKTDALKETFEPDNVNRFNIDLGELWRAINESKKEVNRLKENIGEDLKGSIGPRGFNGSQGPPGPQGPQGFIGSQGPQGIQGLQGPRGFRGPMGLQGQPGVGNLTRCVHKSEEASATRSPALNIDVTASESSDKKIIGVSCSSDDALITMLSVDTSSQVEYKCTCEKSATSSSSGSVKCIIHYWECPLIG